MIGVRVKAIGGSNICRDNTKASFYTQNISNQKLKYDEVDAGFIDTRENQLEEEKDIKDKASPSYLQVSRIHNNVEDP